MPDNLAIALQRLQSKGLDVPANARAALARSLAKYSGYISDDTLDQLLQKFLDGLRDIGKVQTSARAGAAVETGATPTSLRAEIQQLLGQFQDGDKIAAALNLPFKIGTAADVTRGAGRFITAQTDVDEYPAWELSRMYDRAVPRGFRASKGGALIPVPDEDWPSRWREAAEQSGDEAALKVLDDTGRMVALKSSPIWAALGSLREDSLGNAFPPFAFNSGFDVDGVPRNECEDLGLLDAGEEAEPSAIDWKNFLPVPA